MVRRGSVCHHATICPHRVWYRSVGSFRALCGVRRFPRRYGSSSFDSARPGLADVSTPDRVSYLLGLLASGGLILPLLAPELLLLGLPLLAANLLGSYDAMYSGAYHYSAPLVPFLMAATAVGLARIARLTSRWRRGQAAALTMVAFVLAGSLVYHRSHGYTPLAKGIDWRR